MSFPALRAADLALPVRRLVVDLATRLGHECRWAPLLDGPRYECLRCNCGWGRVLRDDPGTEDYQQMERDASQHRSTATAAEIARIVLGSGRAPGAVRAFTLMALAFAGTVDQLALIANHLATEGTPRA